MLDLSLVSSDFSLSKFSLNPYLSPIWLSSLFLMFSMVSSSDTIVYLLMGLEAREVKFFGVRIARVLVRLSNSFIII